MEPIIHDLDENRDKEFIKLGGKELDISFVPCGVSIPLLEKYTEYLDSLKESKVVNKDGTVNKDAEAELNKNPNKAAKNLKIMVELISIFTSTTATFSFV